MLNILTKLTGLGIVIGLIALLWGPFPPTPYKIFIRFTRFTDSFDDYPGVIIMCSILYLVLMFFAISIDSLMGWS